MKWKKNDKYIFDIFFKVGIFSILGQTQRSNRIRTKIKRILNTGSNQFKVTTVHLSRDKNTFLQFSVFDIYYLDSNYCFRCQKYNLRSFWIIPHSFYNRVVCPNFGNPALTSAHTKYIFFAGEK